MTGLWMKIVICPAIVLLTDWISADVYFPAWVQAIAVGVVLALVAHFMEMLLLRPGRLWMMTLLDFLSAAAIIFISQFFVIGAFITTVGALLAASFLMITEYLQHGWLIRSGKTAKAAE